ncbi:MAG TPA: hypothetical protein VG916_05630 [Gemmatimonadaceae bacterium]|nr:hypothetical protein [Gemmatimonadaceae bacterium]
MPPIRRRLVPALAVLAAAAAGGCTSPNTLVQLQGQINEAADAMNDIRVTMGTMQDTIDSLRTVVAKQDTTIFRLANATGVQIAR